MNINFKVENVVFNDMTEDQKTELEQDIQQIIAVQTGVPKANVLVTLSAGSVVVHVEVKPTEFVNAAAITEAVVAGKDTIAGNVIDEMKKMPGFTGSPTIDVSTFTATESASITTAVPHQEDIMASDGAGSAFSRIVSVLVTALACCGIYK